jgi:hypothetical protein
MSRAPRYKGVYQPHFCATCHTELTPRKTKTAFPKVYFTKLCDTCRPIVQRENALNHKASIETKQKMAESMRRAWAESKGKLSNHPRRESKLCACGCGGHTTKGRKWIHGHTSRGKKRTTEHKQRMSVGMKQAWANPSKFVSMRTQSPELIAKRAAAIRGKQRTPEQRQEIAARVHRAWQEGKFSRPETVAKRLAVLASRTPSGCSATRMDEIRAMRDLDKLRPMWSSRMSAQIQHWKDSGQLAEIRRKSRNLKGMPNHLSAKRWLIRDPAGNLHRFSNLSEWVRRHIHLFEDKRPWSKLQFELRVARGLSDLLSDGRSCSYLGWVAVSKSEMLDDGGVDPLERQAEPQGVVRG